MERGIQANNTTLSRMRTTSTQYSDGVHLSHKEPRVETDVDDYMYDNVDGDDVLVNGESKRYA